MRISRGDALAGLTYGWIVMAALGAVVAFLGGSSRADAVQLIGLRPLAALLLVPAFYFLAADRLRLAKTPLLLIAMLAAVMALQLMPLPPALWAALPGRASVAEFLALAGFDDVWRPISMAPDRTLNALSSLIVPICGFIAALCAGFRSRTILAAIAAIGVVSAAIGILQILSGDSSALYMYAVTNKGAPVGLFANQNHAAVFSAITLLVLAYLASEGRDGFGGTGARTIIAGLFVMVLASALLSGSRAGLLLTVMALALAAVMAWVALSKTSSTHRPRMLRKLPAPNMKTLLGAGLALILFVAIGFAGFGGNSTMEALADPESFEDMRWRILPALLEMARTYWLTGVGFGAFEESYHIFETDAALSRYYINQAHNDWLQFLIEGGILAVAWLVMAFAWGTRSFIAIVRQSGLISPRSLLWFGVVTTIALASGVDYPLRTPIFQLALAWFAVALLLQRQAARIPG